MTREDFRREIGDAFDSISGSPDPGLHQRVRSALVEAPENQRVPVWIGALAAAVIVVILVGVLLVVNPLKGSVPVPGTHPSPSPSPIPTASPFQCAAGFTTLTNQTAPPTALITAVRIGTHAGYDRVTIEFKDSTTGTIQVFTQAYAQFITDPKGETVTLAGRDGLLVKISGADSHTVFRGSTDIKTSYPGILEVRELGDFEGKVQWGLGLASSPCYRVAMLENPTRLVIDIQTSK